MNLVLFFFSLLFLGSCKHNKISSNDDDFQFDLTPMAFENGGVVLTFDDWAVDSWLLTDEQLRNYKWKATFCISNINDFGIDTFEKIRNLEKRDHEIAGHGYAHLDAPAYIESKGIDWYLQNEIYPLIDAFEDQSMSLNSFAYPYGRFNEESYTALQDNFIIQRLTIKQQLPFEEQVCFFNGSDVVYAFSLDDLDDPSYVMALIDYAEKNKFVVVFYSHVPVTKLTANHQTSINLLIKICEKVQNSQLKFYTLNDLVQN